MTRPLRVLYVFTARKRDLLARVARGAAPDTLLFGYNHLQRDGDRAGLLRAGVPARRPGRRPPGGSPGPRFAPAAYPAPLPPLRRRLPHRGLAPAARRAGHPARRRPRLVWLNMTLTNLLRRAPPVERPPAPGPAERRPGGLRRPPAAGDSCGTASAGTPGAPRWPSPGRTPASTPRTGPEALRRRGGERRAERRSGRGPGLRHPARRPGKRRSRAPPAPGVQPPQPGRAGHPGRGQVRYDISPDALRDEYGAARTVAIPTQGDHSTAGSDCSGTLVLLDALAMGRPAVITQRDSVPDYVTRATRPWRFPRGMRRRCARLDSAPRRPRPRGEPRPRRPGAGALRPDHRPLRPAHRRRAAGGGRGAPSSAVAVLAVSLDSQIATPARPAYLARGERPWAPGGAPEALRRAPAGPARGSQDRRGAGGRFGTGALASPQRLGLPHPLPLALRLRPGRRPPRRGHLPARRDRRRLRPDPFATGLVAYIVARRPSCPLTCRCTSTSWTTPTGWPSGRAPGLNALGKWLLRRADTVRVGTTRERASWKPGGHPGRAHRRRPGAGRPGTLPTRPRPAPARGPGARGAVVLNASRLVPQKTSAHPARGGGAGAPQRPGTRFVIAGDDGPGAELEALAATLGVAEGCGSWGGSTGWPCRGSSPPGRAGRLLGVRGHEPGRGGGGRRRGSRW